MSNAPAGTPVPSVAEPSMARPVATADRTVYLVGHAHLDPVWLWPWQEGYQEARATLRSALDRMNADPFGHNAMLPQILRGQGMDSYTFLRPGPHEGDLEPSTFWWEAPDGSRVLAYRIPNEYGSGAGPVDGQLEKAIAAARTTGELIMVFYGVGNHGGGPTRANLDSIHRFDRMGSFGRLTLSSPRVYLDAVLTQVEAGGSCRYAATTCNTTRRAATRRTRGSRPGSSGRRRRCSRPNGGRRC
jgi:alpha-mannosidase